MSKVYTEAASRRVADRLQNDGFGFDPTAILALLNVILPALANCLNRNDDPQDIYGRVQQMYEDNPQRLITRVKRNCRAEAMQEWRRQPRDQRGPKMTWGQAEDMARAIIAEAIGSTPEFMASVSDEAETAFWSEDES